MEHLTIRRLKVQDLAPIAGAFAALGWNKPLSQYEGYLQEQEAAQRDVLVAFIANTFVGYLTICWSSDYPSFREAQIPEIVDFNVLPVFRRKGIGTRLMDTAEGRVAQVSPVVGIGVGMTADYGSAQRLYIRRGYLPDGRGLMKAGQPVQYGELVVVNDALCLYFTKQFSGSV